MAIYKKVDVLLDNRSYRINIGVDLFSELASELKATYSLQQIYLVSDETVYAFYGHALKKQLEEKGLNIITKIIPPGEENKSWQRAEEILNDLIIHKYNRDSVMLGLGGGVIGDLAGFVAAIYQRGINFIQVPTTLLAQVDSSVGGKVAVNHPGGKNLIGAFYQPQSVWSDLNTFNTLPEREWLSGLAEIVKYGVIWDEEFFELIEKNAIAIKSRESEIVQELINYSCQIKAHIVAKDEKEENLRAILNFGHTIAHAIESATGYSRYRHGEAVAIGMIGAINVAIKLGKAKDDLKDRVFALHQKLGLPTSLANLSIEEILDHLMLDKKIKDKELVFILPHKIGHVEIVKGIELTIVKEALLEMQ